MTLSNTAEYRVSAKGFNAVKRICSKITNQESRRRAFKALLCMDTLADYLYSQGFNIDISKNLYKILPLNEEFEFTDIHFNGRFIDIVPVVNGQYVLIPKNHTIFDVIPELYVVADYNQTTKKVKFLGCFEGDKIPKNVENGKYYVCDIKNIQSPALVEELLSSVKPDELSENSHALFVSFFIDYLDGVLDDTSKKRLITHLIECKECRSELVEFFDYEMIAKETKNHPELFADNTLDIVGAVAANAPKYKDFKEYTIPIEKQKDEYDEDEEDEKVGGKQIKSAIEDPLQILYGKDKNKKIFDLMGERPKKSTSMLDSVISDISKQSKPKTEPIEKEELNVSYKGAINPEYYSDDLPEGTDVDTLKDDLHLDILDNPPKIQKTVENDDVYEIVEENDDDILTLSDNDDFEPLKDFETKIPHSLKSDVDRPEFSSQLNPEPENQVTASDEMILLDEEKNVDEPEFVINKQNQDVQKDEKDENDDFITINDEDEFDILKPKSDENSLPTSMDNVVYYDEDDKKSEEIVNNDYVDFIPLDLDDNDDVIEILDDETNVLSAEIKLPEENDSNLPDESNIELVSKTDDLVENEEQFDNSTQNPDNHETIEIISDETDNEISEDELIHFDAVDIDIVDENDLQYLNKQSVIPETIENAGVAASSLIDDFEDDKKESIAKAVSKSAEIAGAVTKSILNAKADELTNNIVTGAKIISNLTSIEDKLPEIKNEPQKSNKTVNNTISAEDEDFLIIDENEDDNILPESLKTDTTANNTISVDDDDFLVIDENEDDNFFAQPSKSDAAKDNTISVDENSDDDFLIIDEDENEQTQSYSVPTNAGATDDDFVVINDDKTDNSLNFSDDTNSADDDFLIIDEDENEQTQSIALPTDVEQDDDFVIIDDEDEIARDNTNGVDDFAPMGGGDSFVNASQSDFDTIKNTDSVEDDMVIIDDDDDTFLNSSQNAHSDTNDTNSVNEFSASDDEKIPDVEDLHDNLLVDLPMIKKENAPVTEEKTPVAEENIPALSDDDLLSFGNEDDSDLLSFDDGQDFLLTDNEDDSFLLREEPDDANSQPQPQQVTQTPQPQVVQNTEEVAQSEDDEDDLIIIDDDDDNSSFINSSENAVPAINNTNSVSQKEDDTFLNPLSSDTVKKPIESDFEPIADNTDYDDSVNFFRPAGASFNDNNDDFIVINDDDNKDDNSFLNSSDTTDNTNSVDDMVVIDDEDDNVVNNTEEKASNDNSASDENGDEDEIEFMDEIGVPQEPQPKKPVSQLDLIFNSLSAREKEQIDAVQSGKKEEKNSLLDDDEEIKPKKDPTKRSIFNTNIKDAISAKEEAVEDGRISLSSKDEPIVDPLINTTVEKIDEDEYEYEENDDAEEQDTQNDSDINDEEVEYVYEDENGNEYIPQEGEEVEYVYEDEDGNIISDDDVIVEDDETNEKVDKDEPNVVDVEEIHDEPAPKSDDSYEEEDFLGLSEDDTIADDDFVAKDRDGNLDEIPDFENTSDNGEDENPEELNEEIDEEAEEEGDEESSDDEENQDKKKAIIKKAAIAAAVVLVLAGGGIATKVILSHSNAQAEQQALNEGALMGENAETSEEEGGLAVPSEGQPATEAPVVGGEEGGLAIPESDAEAVLGGGEPAQVPAPAPETTGPKAGTSNATTSDMNKAVANAFSESPSSFSVRKASWGVGASLAADVEFKTYLQKMGKMIKANLRKNLASVKGEAPANPVKVQIKMTDTGALQDVVILKSSGKPEVDEVVLQSVKQTAEACPFPELSENTLKANQKATGNNTVKMSLTVTF